MREHQHQADLEEEEHQLQVVPSAPTSQPDASTTTTVENPHTWFTFRTCKKGREAVNT